MKKFLPIAYLVLEITAFALMVKFLGFGWAVLISIAAMVVGVLVLRAQGRRIFGQLRRASRNEVDPRGPLTDTALLGASTILLVLPGIVSTVVGTVLLAPPVRRLARPAVAAFGAAKFVGVMDSAGLYATGVYGRGRVIDGDVVTGQGHTPSSYGADGADGYATAGTTVFEGTVVDDADVPRQLPRGR